MVVCTYFQQGRCKFGDRCKYEHPGHQTLGSSNRFGVLSGSSGDGSNVFGARRPLQTKPLNYGVTAEDIKADLTAGKGRPDWIFSSYGPGKNIPRQLFGGPQREQSFEEMRLRHYEATAAGNQNQAIQEAQNLYAESLQQIETALKDVDGALRYIVEGENEHPNRIDITEGRSTSNAVQQPSGFGQTSTPFGQSSTASAPKPSPFGQPSTASAPTPSPFGQPSTASAPTPSPFGQPSALGSGTSAFGKPAFGQPSGLGSQSAFGQTSNLGQGTAFGQASNLGGTGQPAFGKPAFGQPSFGQPAALGQGALGQRNTTSPFGQISNQNQGTSPFGQPPTTPAQTNPSPFGQPATTSPFGQPSSQPSTSPFAQISGQTQPSPFGQPSTAQGPFGGAQQTPQAASPFGQIQQNPTPFGQPSAAPNPFGAAQTKTTTATTAANTTTSPFGQPAPPTRAAAPATQQQPPMTTTTPANLGPKPNLKVEDKELTPIPPLSGPTTRDPLSKKLTTWKGRPVRYIDDRPCYLHPEDNQTYVHIFFPDGPPDAASLRDAQGKPEEYTPEVTASYEFFLQNGHFKDGFLPSVPPKTEWVSFDF